MMTLAFGLGGRCDYESRAHQTDDIVRVIVAIHVGVGEGMAEANVCIGIGWALCDTDGSCTDLTDCAVIVDVSKMSYVRSRSGTY